MNTAAEAEQFCHFLWHMYLEERTYEIRGGYFSPEISVIGTGKHEVSYSLKEFASSLEKEEKQWNGSFIIEHEDIHSRQLSEDTYLVFGELDVSEDARDRINYELHFRFTVILKYTTDGWELLHVHQSVPDINQSSDEFFPKRLIEQSNEQLREKIAQKTRELQESNKAVIYYSHHDYLTKLMNRYYCEKSIEEQMQVYAQGTILMMDVDHFKSYNDTYGHPVGDQILIALAQALLKTFPKDIVSRIGGDEFCMYLNHISCIEDIEKNALRIIDNIRNLNISKLQKQLTVSMGICIVDTEKDFEDIFMKADHALYEAKANGRDQFVVYKNDYFSQIMQKKEKRKDRHEVTVNDILPKVFEMLNVFDKRDELLAQTMEFICRSMNVKNIFLLRFENEAYSMGRVYIYDLERNKASKHVHIQTDPAYLKAFDDRHLYYQNQINVNDIRYINAYEQYQIQATLQHQILYDHRMIGVLGMNDRRIHEWNEDDLSLIRNLSYAFATYLIAIEK